VEIKPGEEKRKLNLTVVRDHHELTVPVELERPGLGERENVATVLGIDAGEWQRAQAAAKAQMAAAQLALQKAQRQLLDQQRLISEKMRHALEEYQRAIQQQLKLKLHRQLDPLAGQNRAI
jgi:Fe-S cluster assembly scaffold protein SufB